MSVDLLERISTFSSETGMAARCVFIVSAVFMMRRVKANSASSLLFVWLKKSNGTGGAMHNLMLPSTELVTELCIELVLCLCKVKTKQNKQNTALSCFIVRCPYLEKQSSHTGSYLHWGPSTWTSEAQLFMRLEYFASF